MTEYYAPKAETDPITANAPFILTIVGLFVAVIVGAYLFKRVRRAWRRRRK